MFWGSCYTDRTKKCNCQKVSERWLGQAQLFYHAFSAYVDSFHLSIFLFIIFHVWSRRCVLVPPRLIYLVFLVWSPVSWSIWSKSNGTSTTHHGHIFHVILYKFYRIQQFMKYKCKSKNDCPNLNIWWGPKHSCSSQAMTALTWTNWNNQRYVHWI